MPSSTCTTRTPSSATAPFTVDPVTTPSGETGPAGAPGRGRSRRRAGGLVSAGVLACALLLAGCGGSDDDASDTTSTDQAATGVDDGSTDGSTDGSADGSTGAPDLDLCAEITADEVGAVLGVAITHAVPNEVWTTPNCVYSIDLDGFPDGAKVAAIQWFEPPYFEGQQQLQTDAESVPELDAGILLDTGSPLVILQGTSGDFQVEGGVELTVGGEPASADQLVELAVLAQEL